MAAAGLEPRDLGFAVPLLGGFAARDAVQQCLEAGIQPPKGAKHWGHGFVQARFNGDLINRRKRYPFEIRGAWRENYRLRETADYHRLDLVTEVQAPRAVWRAQAFVAAVAQSGEHRQ